jgi:hypothetical protein
MRTLLKDVRPDLAEQWHPTKNKEIGLSLDTMTAANPKKAWWIGKCGHEYFAQVVERAGKSADLGCSYCAGKKILTGFNDLATLRPHLVAEWHPTKNPILTPQTVGIGVRKEAWWICKAGHEWSAMVYSRCSGAGCPICAGNAIQTGVNDLATINPVLAKEWHPVKNGMLKASDVGVKSNTTVWWKGNCGHEWESVIYSRTVGKGCPICTNKKISIGHNDLESMEPLIAAQWHPTKNKELTPSDVTTGYTKGVWWLCEKNHEWKATVDKRTIRKQGCPKCSNRISNLERDLYNHLVSLGLEVIQSDRKVLHGKEIDMYIPSKNIGIEFNGLYYHAEKAGKSRGKTKTYHYDKWLAAKNAGIQLIQIWEDDWNDKKDIVLKGLEYKLGLSKQEKISARKLKTRVADVKETKAFLNTTHIQGYTSGSRYIALVDETDTIQALMVLKNEKGVYEITRYATASNVVGGFTKLLSYAEKTYKPKSFMTYSDHAISNGKLYENTGFIADKEIPPNYMYILNGKRYHGRNYRIERFQRDPNLIYVEGETATQLAELNGLKRIWDAGKTRWVKLCP